MALSPRDERLLDGHMQQLRSSEPETALVGVAGIARLAQQNPPLILHLAAALDSQPHALVAQRIVRALQEHAREPEAAAALKRFNARRSA